ncbi:hypothetical protein DCAR_0310783 [Daucus carota subsp. sativus]|uniref:DUF676 domain-containing protein n=1 Tax=Daucus carota subsp. sativus TaxID=79200 RepID=A0AAF0WKX3_DAUCS|nr:PREDICTED: putative lipase ROG1 isoform X1 [Daucus carota subsp. sativus]WOG91534.1 hypothetical protein DCAR_0310783 [Daucus carota subsp. sativus]
MELEKGSEEMIRSSAQADGDDKMRKKKSKKMKRRKNLILGCFRRRKRDDYGDSTIEEADANGNLDMESASNIGKASPSHLVVTVNGIIGSAQNWRYAAKQFLKRYPHDVVVHCSESNHSMLTFDGVDVMGSRLADEVLSVIKRHPGLQKISFISHSLGGLVSRYAIAKLYTEDSPEEKCEVKGESPYREEARGTIAGLEPVNFITSATPHLGCRGHRQIPMFCGILAIEKAATNVSWLLGRTGKHLFLTDKDDGKPPLLLQMVNDCEDLKFISALQSFKRRVAYANARFDHIVGWSTSSLRRRNELPKKQKLPRNTRYPHVINEEPARTDHFCKAEHNDDLTDDIEETMIRGLTKLSWERVDVSFKGSRQRLMAHSTIQVKTPFINSDGADVIQHMLDNFLL